MATQQNPFDIETGTSNTQLGLIAGAAPQLQPSQVTASTAAAPTRAVSGAAPVLQADPTRAGIASQSTAQRVAFDPEKQTVQGQLAGILASGNPLLVQAQTRAKQAAQARGLLNSSMAVQAGEEALYGAALPIATPDAAAYQQRALTEAQFGQQSEMENVAARNAMEQLNVQEAGQTGRFNVGEASATGRFNVQEAGQMERFNVQEAGQAQRQQAELSQQAATENARLAQAARSETNQNQMKLMLQQMDANTRTDLVNIEANYKTLMQSSQSASDMYNQTVRNISDITANKDMDAASKNAAIAQQKAFLDNGMALIGSMNNLNLSGLLNFGDLTENAVPEREQQPTSIPSQPYQPPPGYTLVPQQYESMGGP